jgi:phage-related minor tail protein
MSVADKLAATQGEYEAALLDHYQTNIMLDKIIIEITERGNARIKLVNEYNDYMIVMKYLSSKANKRIDAIKAKTDKLNDLLKEPYDE